jgi:HK97 family phage prohead protease
MNRAYAILDIKAISEDGGLIEGIASTPTPDRMGDIVDPMGAKFALPMPLLWQHNHDEPIGQVEFAKPTPKGIPFKARLANPDDFESQTLKERLILARESIVGGLVRAVSIGFRSIEHSVMDNGGWRFLQWEWLELSAVTIPANADAVITTIKAFDVGRPADDREDQQIDPEPAPSGKKVHVVKLATPPASGPPLVINRIHHLR